MINCDSVTRGVCLLRTDHNLNSEFASVSLCIPLVSYAIPFPSPHCCSSPPKPWHLHSGAVQVLAVPSFAAVQVIRPFDMHGGSHGSVDRAGAPINLGITVGAGQKDCFTKTKLWCPSFLSFMRWGNSVSTNHAELNQLVTWSFCVTQLYRNLTHGVPWSHIYLYFNCVLCFTIFIFPKYVLFSPHIFVLRLHGTL